jgi:hypothetical protein
MSINRATIIQQVLDDLLISDRGNFDLYLGRSSTFPVIPIDTLSGLIQQLPVSQGRVAMEDAANSAKVAPGAPYPRGNLEFSQRVYKADPYGFEETLNDIISRETDAYAAAGLLRQVLRERAGLNTVGGLERSLERILLGLGTSTDGTDVTVKALLAAERFNVYSPASDVVATLEIESIGGGAPTQICGDKILKALKRHPQVTDKFAGTGTEIAGQQRVIEWLLDQGFGQVIHTNNESTRRARELGYLRGVYHDLVFCAFQPGAIRRVVQEELTYDVYREERSRTEVLRAYLTQGYTVAHPEDVIALQDVL